jgi:hypothetical protein
MRTDLPIKMGTKKRSYSKIGKRSLMVGGAFSLASTFIVSAAIILSFGSFDTTLHISQAVFLDGMGYEYAQQHPIQMELSGDAGCWICSDVHRIINNACEPVELKWRNTGDIEGIEILMKNATGGGGGQCDRILTNLELEVLDGAATWDDFEVYFDGILVYTYDAKGGDPEDWIMHNISLTRLEIPCCGTHEIRVNCTAPEAWQYFNPYGQLAVNYAALYCEPPHCDICQEMGLQPVLCDEVDIGKPASEAGHDLSGWSAIQPETAGGSYGGIDDCRTTWSYTQGDTPPLRANITDRSDATFTLTCTECCGSGNEGCDEYCQTIVDMKDGTFTIPAKTTIMFCICYKSAANAVTNGEDFHIQSYLEMVN